MHIRQRPRKTVGKLTCALIEKAKRGRDKLDKARQVTQSIFDLRKLELGIIIEDLPTYLRDRSEILIEHLQSALATGNVADINHIRAIPQKMQFPRADIMKWNCLINIHLVFLAGSRPPGAEMVLRTALCAIGEPNARSAQFEIARLQQEFALMNLLEVTSDVEMSWKTEPEQIRELLVQVYLEINRMDDRLKEAATDFLTGSIIMSARRALDGHCPATARVLLEHVRDSETRILLTQDVFLEWVHRQTDQILHSSPGIVLPQGDTSEATPLRVARFASETLGSATTPDHAMDANIVLAQLAASGFTAKAVAETVNELRTLWDRTYLDFAPKNHLLSEARPTAFAVSPDGTTSGITFA